VGCAGVIIGSGADASWAKAGAAASAPPTSQIETQSALVKPDCNIIARN
jgi:hypothetical protein